MIIDFTLENFRSIKDKHTFSMYADSSSHLPSNVSYPSSDGKLGVLKTAGIYGANASGKSNLLLAISALRFLVLESGDLKDEEPILCYEPFILSFESRSKPTTFEMEFFVNELRFVYEVSYNAKKIISESLDFFPSRQKANIFLRKEGQSWEDVSFGSLYKGGRKKFALFENNSYLSKAGNSADAPPIIRSVYNYIRKSLVPIGGDTPHLLEWKKQKSVVDKVAKILSYVDTGISGLEFKEEDAGDFSFLNEFPEDIRNRIVDYERSKPIFIHKTLDGSVEKFTEEMESAGTIKLYHFLPMLLLAFKENRVFLVDELDNNLHPHIAEFIINLFNDPLLNTKNSQLIFTSHNVNLMSPKHMRRDQVWLVEKDSSVTKFSSISQFDKSVVKSDSPYDRWYFEGRFGAVPKIDSYFISEILTKDLEVLDAKAETKK
jgi:AAA15 family ATPase/GTPase